MTPFNRPYGLLNGIIFNQYKVVYTTLYWSAVVTIALSCTIFELFDVQDIVTLKSRLGVTEGHWKWRHSEDCLYCNWSYRVQFSK